MERSLKHCLHHPTEALSPIPVTLPLIPLPPHPLSATGLSGPKGKVSFGPSEEVPIGAKGRKKRAVRKFSSRPNQSLMSCKNHSKGSS